MVPCFLFSILSISLFVAHEEVERVGTDEYEDGSLRLKPRGKGKKKRSLVSMRKYRAF